MRTLSEINFNYRQAINQASRLEEIASQMKHASDQDMERILGDVSKAWKSDSSPQYIKKGQKVQSDIRVTERNLRQIASAIRSIANTVRNAELEAWRIANERK